jgi:putative ABC transport system permease protein
MNVIESLMSLEMGLIYGIVAIGIYLTFRTIDFPDLTCDGSFVLGAALSSVLTKAGLNPLISILVAFVGGSLSGYVTGFLHTRFKITNLLSGILVAFMLYSINLKVMGGIPNIALIHEKTIFTNQNALLILLLISALIFAAYSYLLKTDFGLALRSIGQNKRLAMNSGVRIDHMTLIALSLSNGLIALGGALFSQHQGFCDITQGLGTVIIGLASVMIGEKILPFRSVVVAIFSCLLGSIIYRFFIAVALHSDWLGLETQDLNLVTGLMIIGVMLMPRIRRRYVKT